MSNDEIIKKYAATLAEKFEAYRKMVGVDVCGEVRMDIYVCNRCMYTWNDYSVCPLCGKPPTHEAVQASHINSSVKWVHNEVGEIFYIKSTLPLKEQIKQWWRHLILR